MRISSTSGGSKPYQKTLDKLQAPNTASTSNTADEIEEPLPSAPVKNEMVIDVIKEREFKKEKKAKKERPDIEEPGEDTRENLSTEAFLEAHHEPEKPLSKGSYKTDEDETGEGVDIVG